MCYQLFVALLGDAVEGVSLSDVFVVASIRSPLFSFQKQGSYAPRPYWHESPSTIARKDVHERPGIAETNGSLC